MISAFGVAWLGFSTGWIDRDSHALAEPDSESDSKSGLCGLGLADIADLLPIPLAAAMTTRRHWHHRLLQLSVGKTPSLY